MTETISTPYNKRCEILADLWLDYSNKPDWQDFFAYNNLGSPLAYAIHTDIVLSTGKAETFINETFEILLLALEVDEDTGFDSLDDLMGL